MGLDLNECAQKDSQLSRLSTQIFFKTHINIYHCVYKYILFGRCCVYVQTVEPALTDSRLDSQMHFSVANQMSPSISASHCI